MRKYIIMPEGCHWYEIEATTPEMAFRSECCWFGYGCKIAVMDAETKETTVYIKGVTI